MNQGRETAERFHSRITDIPAAIEFDIRQPIKFGEVRKIGVGDIRFVQRDAFQLRQRRDIRHPLSGDPGDRDREFFELLQLGDRLPDRRSQSAAQQAESSNAADFRDPGHGLIIECPHCRACSSLHRSEHLIGGEFAAEAFEILQALRRSRSHSQTILDLSRLVAQINLRE